MTARPHKDLSDEALYRAYKDANDLYGEATAPDEEEKYERLRDGYYDEIGWRSVYMQNMDEDGWINTQRLKLEIEGYQQRIAELEAEVAQLKAKEA